MMTIAKLLLPELEVEAARTRRVLAAVPADKLDWSPGHELHTIGWNANHLADILDWVGVIVNQSEFDIAPPDGPPHETPSLATPAEILASYDSNLVAAKNAIGGASDEILAEPWTMRMRGQELFTISKGECLRTWVLNHTVHHRAILSVYLRMAGVELTPVYDG